MPNCITCKISNHATRSESFRTKHKLSHGLLSIDTGPRAPPPEPGKYDINDPEALFRGYDTWHAYEAGFLTRKGLPVCGVLKIVYPANSPNLVESKSLKLYLNSLNMTRLGDDVPSGIESFVKIVKSDLEQILETRIDIVFHTQETVPEYDFDNYAILEKLPEAAQTTFSEYTETPELLAENMCQGGEIKVGSHLLRSNCKITKQPDWGSVFIRLKAERLPAPMSLLRYIVSLRAENHFHEEICEMIYKRLHDLFQPEILSVSCLYTRRGGIDICPSRANRVEYLPEAIHDPEVLSRRLLRQ